MTTIAPNPNGNRYQFLNDIVRGKPQHLHTLDGQALFGTSTVLGIIDKPGIKWWAVQKALETLGWKTSKIEGTSKRKPMEERILDPDFQKRFLQFFDVNEEGLPVMTPDLWMNFLDEAYMAHTVVLADSAEVGIDMHAELERYVKWCIAFNDGRPVVATTWEELAETQGWYTNLPPVARFADWADEHIARFIASEAHCYSEKLWTGGIVDLIYEDKYGDLNLLDFKSAKEAYDEHFMQNAGYHIALAENGIFDADGNFIQPFTGAVVAYWSLPFGMPEPTPQPRIDLLDLQQGFKSALFLYKLKKGLL